MHCLLTEIIIFLIAKKHSGEKLSENNKLLIEVIMLRCKISTTHIEAVAAFRHMQ
jgi:hypothetical protein